MVVNEKILKHLDILAGFIEDLKAYSRVITAEDLARDRNKQNMVLYALVEAIQSCIDISNHVIADKGFRRAEDYRELWDRHFCLSNCLIRDVS